MVDHITETTVTTTNKPVSSNTHTVRTARKSGSGEPIQRGTIMDSKAALGAAAALALTVTGGVSALFLTIGQASGSSQDNTETDPAVTVEYVDQYGNPVAPPSISNVATTPEVILVNPDGTIIGQDPTAAIGPTGPAYGAEYEEEDGDIQEDGDQHKDGEQQEDEEQHEEGEHD